MTKQMRTRIGQLAAKLAESLDVNRWADIDQLREQAEGTGLFNREDVALKDEVWNWFVGETVRKAMRRKDAEGYPLFPSIRVPDRDGEKSKRLYMRERRMKPIHYKQFYNECDDREHYWRKLKNATARRCIRRHGVSGQMVFAGWVDPDAGSSAA